MKKIVTLVIAMILVSIQYVAAQDKITPPNKDKAVVYLVRTSAAGSLINFKYFDGEKYLGKFNGRKAFRYECDPGKHTFWAKSENIDFIEADLKAGAIYLIEVKATVGFIKASVKLLPVDATNKRQLKKIYKIFKKKELIDLNTYKISPESEEIYESKETPISEEKIKKGLERIEKKKQKGRKVKIITPDMEYKKV